MCSFKNENTLKPFSARNPHLSAGSGLRPPNRLYTRALFCDCESACMFNSHFTCHKNKKKQYKICLPLDLFPS